MSLFGAARLYVEGADRIARDSAPLDDGSVTPHLDGAWELWARKDDSGAQECPLPSVSRLGPGPVRIAHKVRDPA